MKNKRKYFDQKEELIKKGEILNNQWIVFNHGKVLKIANECIDLNPPKTNVHHLIVKVGHETEFPNLKSRRIYHQKYID